MLAVHLCPHTKIIHATKAHASHTRWNSLRSTSPATHLWSTAWRPCLHGCRLGEYLQEGIDDRFEIRCCQTTVQDWKESSECNSSPEMYSNWVVMLKLNDVPSSDGKSNSGLPPTSTQIAAFDGAGYRYGLHCSKVCTDLALRPSEGQRF